MLNIDKEQFLSIYKGTSVIDYEDIFYSEPRDQKDLQSNYLISKLWRLNNLYTIVDKLGNLITFRMNLSQHRTYAASLKHPRLIILKSRQQGISTFWLVSFFDDACTKTNMSIGLMAQGQDEASTLLTRVKTLWEKLPSAFTSYLGIRVSVDNTKALSLSNGSSIFVRTSFRSTTLQRLHISEMGKIANKYPERAKETKKGTLQALAPGNVGVIESTAEGANMFKDMWDNAVTHYGELSSKDFMPLFLSWIEDPDCVEHTNQVMSEKNIKYLDELELEIGKKLTREQRNFWVSQYRELGDDIYQEYPSTAVEAFMANKDGAYYARLYMLHVKKFKREIENLYDPNLEVHGACDLGINDTNVLIFYQEFTDGIRIIDEIEDNGQAIPYYTDEMKRRRWYQNLVRLALPHDARVMSLTDGKTREEVFREELPGIEIDVLDKTSVMDGIEEVRGMLKRLFIDPICLYVITCILNYSKEWDDKRNKWRPFKPNHDEHSNGADCLRYVAVSRRGFTSKSRKRTNSNRRGMDV